MLLSDFEIEMALQRGDITIEPFDKRYLKPASVDIRLGTGFLTYDQRDGDLDPMSPDFIEGYSTKMFEKTYIDPGEFMLATTLETFKIGLMHGAQLMGKSTLGRLGLEVHATAGFVDPGFQGQLTLELKNVNNRRIVLRPGMPIAQLGFFKLLSMCRYPYGALLDSNYIEQQGVTPPAPLRIYELDGKEFRDE